MFRRWLGACLEDALGLVRGCSGNEQRWLRCLLRRYGVDQRMLRGLLRGCSGNRLPKRMFRRCSEAAPLLYFVSPWSTGSFQQLTPMLYTFLTQLIVV